MSSKQAAARDLIQMLKKGAKSGNDSCSPGKEAASRQSGVLSSTDGANSLNTSLNDPAKPSSTSTPVHDTSFSGSAFESSSVNYVSRLQEWAQGRGLSFPVYRGYPSNDGRNPFCFVVSVPTQGVEEGRGIGRTKKEAKKAAARALYETFVKSNDATLVSLPDRLRANALSLSSSSTPCSASNVSNVVGKLQEMAQKQGLPLPTYDYASNADTSNSGFPFVCTVKAFGASAQGGGKNKKDAKQEAAKELWMLFANDGCKASGDSSPVAFPMAISAEKANQSEGCSNSQTDGMDHGGDKAGDEIKDVISSEEIAICASSMATSPPDDGGSSVGNSESSFMSLSPDHSFNKENPANVEDDDGGVHYVNDGVNYIGMLQEESIRRNIDAPRYVEPDKLVGNSFECLVSFPNLDLAAKGLGRRKKEAKSAAAKALHSKLMSSKRKERAFETILPDIPSDVSKSPIASHVSRLQPFKLDFFDDAEYNEKESASAIVLPKPLSDVEGLDDDDNYVGKLKEYLDTKSYGQARYEDDFDANGVSAFVIVDGVKLVGHGAGFPSKKRMKQAAAKSLMQQLCPAAPIPCSPIGMVVGISPSRKNGRQAESVDEDAITSASLTTASISVDDLVDSTVNVENAEDELDRLVEDLNLPMPEFKISKMKTKGEKNKMLHVCVVAIDGEREKIGSGDTRLEATQRASCNMVQHLRYKHKISPKAREGEPSTAITGDSALGVSNLSDSNEKLDRSLKNSPSKNYSAVTAKKDASLKIFKGFGGSEPRLNLTGSSFSPPRLETVADKTVFMTLASTAKSTTNRSSNGRCRTLSEPSSIADIFLNDDKSAMLACYSAFKEFLKNIGDRSSCFHDTDDRSESATKQRLQIFEDAGVRVFPEPIVRKRATNEEEVVRGKGKTDGILCFLRLNFDPNYEEIEEFQWNRKRRFNKQLVFGGKGATMIDAEADALAKAAEHLKTTISRL